MADQEILPEQVKLTFLNSDGAFWYDCQVQKNSAPHGFSATCDKYQFSLHLLLRQYPHPEDITFEFHYWANETAILKETHTQSIWMTVDKASKAKNIINYIGFSNDMHQLRLEIKL